MRKIVLFFCLPLFCFGRTGLEIATQMEDRNRGFIGEKTKMTMILRTANSEEIKRKMKGKTFEVNKHDKKSLLEFLVPLDIKGTKMLTWSYKSKNSDQWLFLPSIKRVKRISGSGKMASFMGSEFTYEDLSGESVDKFAFKLLKQYKENGDQLYLLERINKKKSGYSKTLIIMSDKYAQPLKMSYYDRRGDLLKVSKQKDFKKYVVKGKSFWRPKSINMINVQTKKESEFIWDERKIGVKIKENNLHKRALK